MDDKKNEPDIDHDAVSDFKPIVSENVGVIDPMTAPRPASRSSDRSNRGRDILSELRDSFNVGRRD